MTDLMQRAQAALQAEQAEKEAASLKAKAEELATEEERAQQAAELKARQEQVRAEVAQALADNPDATANGVAAKFDAAVAALVELADVIEARQTLMQAVGFKLTSAELSPSRELTDDERAATPPVKRALARALILAAGQVQGIAVENYARETLSAHNNGSPDKSLSIERLVKADPNRAEARQARRTVLVSGVAEAKKQAEARQAEQAKQRAEARRQAAQG